MQILIGHNRIKTTSKLICLTTQLECKEQTLYRKKEHRECSSSHQVTEYRCLVSED